MLVADFKPGKTKKIRDLGGTVHVMTLDSITRHPEILDLRERLLGDALDAALLGGGICAGLAVAALFGLHLLGRRLGRGRRLRGGELASAKELKRRTLPWWRWPLLRIRPPEVRPYRIARIPWPKGAETRHTIVSGTTGSGKTVLIADLVEQIRQRGERCIVYDKMGSYTETFFDEHRDVLLNPLDRRAPRWSPFLEARTARDLRHPGVRQHRRDFPLGPDREELVACRTSPARYAVLPDDGRMLRGSGVGAAIRAYPEAALQVGSSPNSAGNGVRVPPGREAGRARLPECEATRVATPLTVSAMRDAGRLRSRRKLLEPTRVFLGLVAGAAPPDPLAPAAMGGFHEDFRPESRFSAVVSSSTNGSGAAPGTTVAT